MPFTFIWRFTLYAPKSVDATEATVLTAGAVSFKVASAAGVAGFEPLLDGTQIEGRSGTFDPLTRKRDIGTRTLRILDRRTGSGNAQRFVTQFVGNSAGRYRLLGLKGKLELSTNGGGAWITVATGRVSDVEFDEMQGLVWRFVLRENLTDLDRDIFTGAPHSSASYATASRVFPVAPNAVTYGPWTAQARKLPFKVTAKNDEEMRLVPNGSTNAQYNLGGTALDASATLGGGLAAVAAAIKRGTPVKGRARVTWTSGALNGQTKHYEVFVAHVASVSFSVIALMLRPLATADPFYAATQAVNTTADIEVWQEGAPTDLAPIYITDTHPAQIIKDICQGYYGPRKANGSPAFTFPFNAAAFTAIIADTSFPKARFVVTKKWNALNFIEQQLCLPFGLGVRVNGDGELVVFDARMPTSLAGLPTLGEADVVAGSVRWGSTRQTAVTRCDIYYYRDDGFDSPLDKLKAALGYGGRPTLVESMRAELWDIELGGDDVTGRKITIDAQGLRFTALDTDRVGSLQRAEWATAWAHRLAEELRRPWAEGAQTVTATLARNATTLALSEGQALLINFDVVPSTTANQRGGIRLVRLTSLTDHGLTFAAEFVDLGRNVQATVPTLGAPATQVSDPSHLITVAVTLNAELHPVELWYAVTATSVGVRPGDNDEKWTFAFTSVGGTATLAVPSSSRIWIRGRSLPYDTERFPSAWAFPSGVGYVDTTAFTTPSGVAVTAYGKSADVSFTAGNANLHTEMALDSAFATRAALLPPGVTQTTLVNLTPSTAYTVYVRHVDLLGGVSAAASAAFSTTATAQTCPAMAGVQVIVGEVL